MNGIVIDIDPTIFHWGHFGLRWYGLFFVLAIFAGSWLGLREARRKGFDAEQVQSLILWAVLGGLVGALVSWRLQAGKTTISRRESRA